MHGKLKHVLRQIQEFFFLREFVVSYDWRSTPLKPRSSFSWRVNWQGDFGHLGEAAKLSQLDTELILVDTNWHWVDTEWLCSGAQQMVGAGGIDTNALCIIMNCYNCQRQSHIIPSKSTSACSVRPYFWALELWAEWPTYFAWTLQKFIIPSHHITVQGSTISSRRLKIMLEIWIGFE